MEKQLIINHQLGRLGSVELKQARSLAIAFEFATLWASELDQSQLARLCAGAIGATTEQHEILPVYRPLKTNPLEYGFTILERLLERGLLPNKVYEIGSLALLVLAQSLPSETEVEDKANFTIAENQAS